MTYLTHPEKFGECRTIANHPWTRNGDALVVERGRVVIHWTCARCGTQRTDRIQRRTGVVKHAYKHPPGYLLHLGTRRRPTKATLRVEYLNHLLRRGRQRTFGTVRARSDA